MIIYTLIIIGVLILGLSVTLYLMSRDKEFMSFRQSMDLVGLPVVTLYSGNNKLNFLLDTGSNNNLINNNDMYLLQCSNTSDKGATMFGVDGKPVTTPVCEGTLYLYKNKIQDVFQVADLEMAFANIKRDYGVTLHGILGSRLFNKYKCVLDFDKMIFYKK